jgi:mRNA-degrading endonuclease RelE of RelBE toxin-antitoxin system
VKLRVSYSALGEDTLRKMRENEKGAQRAALYDGVANLIKTVIAESDLALLPKNRLSGELAGVLRIKKGRFRLFYLASTEKAAAVVLFIGYRKEGDKHDAYVEFERHLKRGAFDQQVAELGLPKPKP